MHYESMLIENDHLAIEETKSTSTVIENDHLGKTEED